MSTIANYCFFILLTITLVSCNFKKKYYYIKDDDEPVVIEASSDSSAYMEAFKKFKISIEAHKAVGKATGGSLNPGPKNFTLLNSNKEDITYTTHFATKCKSSA